jgi:hypothetical protein
LLIFFAVLIAWAVALWHPVRVSAGPGQGPGGAGVDYETFSPQVNARLRAMNDSLRKFFTRRASQP